MKKIVVFTMHEFPFIKEAAGVHLTHWARGLVQNNTEVNIVILFSKKKEHGVFKGVNYKHIYKGKNKLYSLISLFSIFSYLYQLKKQKFKVAIIYGNLIKFDIITPIIRLFGFRLILERNELPYVFDKGLKRKINSFFYKNLILPLFDAFFTVSSNLGKYYNSHIKSKIDPLIIPFMVDIDEFDVDFVEGEYILYCGTLEKEQNGIDILIDAFKIIAKKYQNIDLKLFGFCSNQRLTELRTTTELYGLKDRVTIQVGIKRPQLIRYMKGAKILALAKPDHEQAGSSFPSKLGEYLATGVPIVTTNVGEISRYLTNEANVFFAKSPSAVDFASKLIYVLEHYKEAKIVSNNGLMFVKEYDYRVQAKHLDLFFEKLSV